MAVYNKLLLSSEGGIISANQRSDQENCAVVCIGLGGTGVSCLRTLKEKVYNRLNPDDKEAAVPKYRHIKFLAIDSDKAKMSKSSSIGEINFHEEFFDISNDNIVAAFEGSGEILNTQPEFQNWLRNKEITVDSAKSGAGGVRQVGRFLLIDRSNSFIDKVKKLVSDAEGGLINPTIYIHIFSGMSGGTGAGVFLDVCYLTQYALSQLGKIGKAQIFGYFFLPDVNLSQKGLNSEVERYIKMNGYAAMKELDYCMSFPINGGKWSQTYKGGIRVESSEPPVNLCHLITAQTASGDVIDGAYTYAMNVVSDYIMDFIVRNEDKNTMGIESHISNYNTATRMIHKNHGARYAYCVLGAANAQIPLKEILTYLASKLFGKFEPVRDKLPTQGEIDTFMTQNALTYQQLLQALNKGVDGSFPPSGYTYGEIRDEGNSRMVEYYTNLLAKQEGVLETNKRAMLHPLEDYVDNPDLSSVICRVFRATKAVMHDPEKGPFFAANILSSPNNEDLINKIDGYITENNQRLGQETFNNPMRNEEYERARGNFEEHPRQKYFAEYEYRLKALIQSNLAIRRYSQMDLILKSLKTQITDLAKIYTDPFRRIMETLIETFASNSAYLRDIPPVEDNYVYKLMTIADLRESLDTVVNDMDINGQITRFADHMLSHPEDWQTEDENKISNLVIKYFNAIFSDYSSKTITDYLKVKYSTDNLTVLQEYVKNDIMTRLNAKASPLFWTNGAIYSITSTPVVGYCSVPSASPEIVGAAEDLIRSTSAAELQLRRVNFADRITMLRCLCGVPLFGYQGLTQYEEVYSDVEDFVGRHIYEGKNNGKNFFNLPSPKPVGIIERTAAHYKVKQDAEKIIALYNKAVELGITDTYSVKVTGSEYVDAMIKTGEAAIASGELVQLQKGLKELNEKLANMQYKLPVSILNDGNGDEPTKARVRLDHFAASPNLITLVEGEIAKIEKINSLIETIRAMIIGDTDVDNFQDALFTGIISVKGPKVEFEYNEFGIVSTFPLSMPTFPMGTIPLYQAFVSFKELPASKKDKIKSLVDQRKNSVAPEIEPALRNIAALMNPVYMGAMQKNASRFIEDYDAIIRFLLKIRSEIESFASLYGIVM
ncbi:MAG: tubulin-like doman-containing protein [Oscillospiraceae bacterium]|jgi:hypothetical protein|nr:tubulin-like doman-containing protein [Oscillospiraceae bacterium]